MKNWKVKHIKNFRKVSLSKLERDEFKRQRCDLQGSYISVYGTIESEELPIEEKKDYIHENQEYKLR